MCRTSAKPAGKTGMFCATPCENDFVLVANNAADFRKLYAEEALHAGLVILIPNVPVDSQKHLFKGVVNKLITHGELINHVLEVDLDGEDVIFDLYELPMATQRKNEQ